MPKKWIKRYLPHPHEVKNHKHLKIFGDWIHDPNLWHINRQAVSRAVAVGLFLSFIPLPGHMLLAALLAILLHANLLISVVLVWISNPLTMGPMYFFAYEVGVHLLHLPHQSFHFEPSFKWIFQELEHIALPLFAGAFICGAVLALFGNLVTRIFWRLSVILAWKRRAKHRQAYASKIKA